MRLVLYRGSWAIYERIQGRVRRTSLGTADRAIAERRLLDVNAQRRRKADTVADIIAHYLEDRGPRLRSITTAKQAVRHLGPVFGHLRPDQITRPICRAYASQRKRQGVGDAHVRRELGVMGAALRWHQKDSPATIELPPAPPPNYTYLTREQYLELREAARPVPHCYLFVILAYTTAGRAGAIVGLTWDRVDFVRGLIHLASPGMARGMKGRATVPMTDSAREALLEAQRAARSEYVIEHGGEPIKSLKRTFRTAVLRAGLPTSITPHVLRHTAAVHMAEGGVPMAEIGQYLGHSSESVTYRVYARFSPTYQRKAASVLE